MNGRALRFVPSGDPRLESAPGDLDAAIAHVRAADLVEAAEPHRQTVLDFVARHAEALSRSCPDGHLTGSAAVVDAAGERTLLMLHRKLGRWFQPGGHADGDGNLAAVALREAAEETGIDDLHLCLPAIDLDVHEVEPPGEPAHLHLDLRFLVLAPEAAVEAANHESLALRWVDAAGVEALAPDPSTRRLVRRALTLAGAVPRPGR